MGMGVVERAFELADTGLYVSPTEIAKKLIQEGYRRADITASLEGLALKRQLLARCRAARSPG